MTSLPVVAPPQDRGTPNSLRCYDCPIYRTIGASVVRPRCPPNAAPGQVVYLLVGEAPGHDEVRAGEPFVGRSGQLLRGAMAAVGMDLEQTAIMNATFCAPRDTLYGAIRTPTLDEAHACIGHTFEYLWYFKPQALVLVGGVVWKAVAGAGRSIMADHGKVFLLADVAEHLPLSVLYQDFTIWRQNNKSRLDADPHAVLWSLDFQPKLEEESCRFQMAYARRLGYHPFCDNNIPVIPVIHPAYVLRQGGAQSKGEESIRTDLRAAVQVVTAERPVKNYRFLDTVEAIERYVDETIEMHRQGRCEFIGVDTEASEFLGPDYIWAIPFHPYTLLFMVQVSREPHEGVMIPISDALSPWRENAAVLRIVLHHLSRLLHAVPVVGQNYALDYNILRCKVGIKGYRVVGDAQLADHWYNMGRGYEQNLQALEGRYIGGGHKAESYRWRDANPGKTFDDMPLKLKLEYGCGDSDGTRQVCVELKKRLEADGLYQFYFDTYFGLHRSWYAIVDMMWAGMIVDRVRLEELMTIFPPRIDAVKERLQQNGFVQLFQMQRWRSEDEEARLYNQNLEQEAARALAAGQKPSRKKPWKRYTYPEWAGNQDNWYNPNSVPQTDTLWHQVMCLPVGSMDDLDYRDDLPKDRTKALPKTDDHNRTVILDYLKQWTEQSAKYLLSIPRHPDGSYDPVYMAAAQDVINKVGKWKACADQVEAFDLFKDLTKTFGTYVEGIWALIPDHPGYDGMPGDWNSPPQERYPEVYRPFCDPPHQWTLHSSYKLFGTVTGRISSEKPNGQNYPKKKADRNADVTTVYIVRHRGRGGVLLAADMSQIEVRVLICEAEDHEVAAVINAGRDVHKFVTSKVHSIPEEKVTKELRDPVKRVTFGVIYGQGATSLARQLHKSLQEAQSIIELLFRQIPKMKGYIDRTQQFLAKHGYVMSRLGRRRWIESVFSSKKGEVSAALREGVNMPIQSTAGDFCLTALGRTWTNILELSIDALPFAEIHDAMYYDCGPTTFFDVMEIVYYQMAIVPQLLWPWCIVVPEAEFDLGADWGSLCEAKFIRDKNTKELIHDQLELRGTASKLDRLCEEIARGNKLSVLKAGPHPSEEEAKKGYLQRVIQIDRQPRVLIHNRRLVTPPDVKISDFGVERVRPLQ